MSMKSNSLVTNLHHFGVGKCPVVMGVILAADALHVLSNQFVLVLFK